MKWIFNKYLHLSPHSQNLENALILVLYVHLNQGVECEGRNSHLNNKSTGPKNLLHSFCFFGAIGAFQLIKWLLDLINVSLHIDLSCNSLILPTNSAKTQRGKKKKEKERVVPDHSCFFYIWMFIVKSSRLTSPNKQLKNYCKLPQHKTH